MPSKIPKTKAQANSVELLVGYFIFAMALTIAITLWTTTWDNVNKAEKLDDFETTATYIAEKLVRTPGYPENWTPDNVITIGLANDPRILDNEKIEHFIDMMNDTHISSNPACSGISNYECNKYLLGVGKHEFYMELQYMNWTNGNWTTAKTGNRTCTAGKNPANAAAEEITVARTAIFQQNITRMLFTLWHNETGAL